MDPNTNSTIQTYIFGGQLLAYIGTFYFLIRSLNAQRRANDLTNKKFVYDIRPFFTLSHPDAIGSINAPQDTFFEKYLIKLEKNVARDFYIEVDSKSFYQEKYHSRKLPIVPVGDEFEIIYGDISYALIHAEVNINIYFSDEIGTAYSQLLRGQIHTLKLDPPLPSR